MDIATDNLGGLNKDSKILSANSVIEALNTHDATLTTYGTTLSEHGTALTEHATAIENKFSNLSTALVAQINENKEFKTALKTALGIA